MLNIRATTRSNQKFLIKLFASKGNIKAKGECKEVALDYLQYCNAVSYGEETAITALRGSQNLNLDKKIANNPGALINKSKNMIMNAKDIIWIILIKAMDGKLEMQN